ncbi:MAG: hypothetical protein ABIP49_04315 [Lysobacterales bacterium]
MLKHTAVFAVGLIALAITQTAQAIPNCTRKPGSTSEISPAGTRQFPLSGPCHTLAIAPPAGTPITGFMLIVAAGGWNSNPQAVRNFHNAHAQRFANDGFFTYTVEHTPGTGTALGPNSGHTGFNNLAQHYDELRAFVDTLPNGAAYPICAFGESSGGNFALLLGVVKPGLNCIVTQGAPTDLRNVSDSMPAVVRQLAIDAFGVGNLPIYSPIAWADAGYLNNKVLLGHALVDPLVGSKQATDFCARRPASAQCYVLDTRNGTAPFTHALVTPAALNTFRAMERAFTP